jgi:hypothetical protein
MPSQAPPIHRRTPWPLSPSGLTYRLGVTNVRHHELPDWDSNCIYVHCPLASSSPEQSIIIREIFAHFVREQEDLLKIQVLTFCFLPNHVHLLLRVPDRKKLQAPFYGPAGEQALIEHYQRCIGPKRWAINQVNLDRFKDEGQPELAAQWMNKLRNRIGSVNEFLKQAKSNAIKNPHPCSTKESQWTTRYRSSLVEDRHPAASDSRHAGGSRTALRLLALHLDLMPQHEGFVSASSEYRWTGWSAALRGDPTAIAGICDLVGCPVSAWASHARPTYAAWLQGTAKAKEPLSHRIARAIEVLSVPGAIGFPRFIEEAQSTWIARFPSAV